MKEDTFLEMKKKKRKEKTTILYHPKRENKIVSEREKLILY